MLTVIVCMHFFANMDYESNDSGSSSTYVHDCRVLIIINWHVIMSLQAILYVCMYV